jgi:penicillin-binding protein-related factor A (putative recombinase)
MTASALPVLSRADAGRLGRKRGAVFEKFLVEHIFRPARDNGLFVRFDRQHPDMIPTRSPSGDGSPLFRLGRRSGADWIALLPKGHPFSYLAIEAKSIDAEALPLSKLDGHQIEHLNEAVTAGQGALLLVQYQAAAFSEIYAVPWEDAPWKKSGVGHSLARIDLGEVRRLRHWQCLERVLRWKR